MSRGADYGVSFFFAVFLAFLGFALGVLVGRTLECRRTLQENAGDIQKAERAR